VTLASLLLVIAAAGLHAGWNALAKRGRDPVVFLWCATVASTLALLPFGLWILARDGLLVPALPFVGGTILLHTLYFYALGRAYGTGAYSLVYPVARGQASAGQSWRLVELTGASRRWARPGGARRPQYRGPVRYASTASWPGRAILWPVLTGLAIAPSHPRKAGVGRLELTAYMLLLEGGCALLGDALLWVGRSRAGLAGWLIVAAAVMSAGLHARAVRLPHAETSYVVAAAAIDRALGVIGRVAAQEMAGTASGGGHDRIADVACGAFAR
jgi:hypothetical protein